MSDIVQTRGPLVCSSCGVIVSNSWCVSVEFCYRCAVYTQTITLTDAVAPTWDDAAGALDVSVACDDAAGLAAAQALFPTASDNCDLDVSDIVKTSGPLVGSTCGGSYTNTWVVTDDCGNTSAVYTQTITLTDAVAPTASNPSPVFVECSDDVPAPDIAVVDDAADNCSIPVVAFVSDISDGLSNPETITRTYSVTDECGNSINVIQLITVIDITPPVIAACPTNITITADTAAAGGQRDLVRSTTPVWFP